jgi:hypothetical protein
MRAGLWSDPHLYSWAFGDQFGRWKPNTPIKNRELGAHPLDDLSNPLFI